mmetsp:Transcript_41230/g.106760  ORF Transcript_41230/g.106760 Transcript_41230/m.106760 type:complete len:360 (+) Transcript_41230:609-1688(+)
MERRAAAGRVGLVRHARVADVHAGRGRHRDAERVVAGRGDTYVQADAAQARVRLARGGLADRVAHQLEEARAGALLVVRTAARRGAALGGAGGRHRGRQRAQPVLQRAAGQLRARGLARLVLHRGLLRGRRRPALEVAHHVLGRQLGQHAGRRASSAAGGRRVCRIRAPALHGRCIVPAALRLVGRVWHGLGGHGAAHQLRARAIGVPGLLQLQHGPQTAAGDGARGGGNRVRPPAADRPLHAAQAVVAHHGSVELAGGKLAHAGAQARRRARLGCRQHVRAARRGKVAPDAAARGLRHLGARAGVALALDAHEVGNRHAHDRQHKADHDEHGAQHHHVGRVGALAAHGDRRAKRLQRR